MHGVHSDALMAAELSSYFCLLVAWFSSWFSASQQIDSCVVVVAVEYRGLYFKVGLVYKRPLLFAIGLVPVTYRCLLLFGTLDSALGLHVNFEAIGTIAVLQNRS